MEQALTVHRLHFAFTITFHYIFPQLTMGLALLLVYLKTKFLRTGDEHYNRSARFWAASSQLILPSVSSLESRWNFSLAPTGRRFRELPAASLGKRWRWKAFFLFSSNPVSLVYFYSVRKNSGASDIGCPPFSYSSARGSPATSSSPPTHGCNTPPATFSAPTAKSNSPASGAS